MTNSVPMKTLGIILAAGKGTRMKSDTPKVLHTVLGTPIVERVIQTLKFAGVSESTLVLGGNLDNFQDLIKNYPNLTIVQQLNQKGTGDAVASISCILPQVKPPPFAASKRLIGPEKADATHILICCGDTPALDGLLLKDFVESCLKSQAPLGLIGMRHPKPTGYGRLVLDQNSHLIKIVEEKDADAAIRAIDICNTGIIFGKIDVLFPLLAEIKPNNSQNEYYLTDCFSLAREKGIPVHVTVTPQYSTFEGVNDRVQLGAIEADLLAARIQKLMQSGVTFHHFITCFLEDSVEIEPDVEIYPNVVLLGKTHIGKGSKIGANSVLTDVKVKPGTRVKPGSYLENTTVT